MKRLSANISFMFADVPFLDRFERAARAGFRAVEFHFPYEHPATVVAEKLAANDLELVVFNTAPGNVQAGEWGLGALAGRESDFRDHLNQALEYASVLKPSFLHVMCGKCAAQDRERSKVTFIENLKWATSQSDSITFLVEALNQRDMPGYFLSYQEQSAEIVHGVGAQNVKLMFDLYHVQVMEGDLAKRLERYLPIIGHIQIAAVPSRHEPDEGEVSYRFIFEHLAKLRYKGFVGCEYKPRALTEDGLGWIEKVE